MDFTTQAIEPDFGTGKKTLKMYVLGLVLCVILTLVPFAVVMHGGFPPAATFWCLIIAAILQFFVQVYCFLRLNTQTEQGTMNILAFVFAVVVLAVIVGGSLWIMWNLNYNMMH